jgi:Tfp pilus assembly protein PilP
VTRHPLPGLVLPILAGLLLASSGAVRAQEHPPAESAGAPPAGSPKEETETINRIMQDNEAMLSGRGFTYDPAGRRDPFRSLVDALNSAQKGPRPRGIAGMLISEVDLVGIVQKGKGYIAFFNGSDNKGYFLRVGDTLYDGKIIRIDRKTGTVTFRQDINDPRSIKPYRDVTKRLTTAEEGSL